MARAIELIERDIAALEEAIATLTSEFQQTYERYLNALGQAVLQQLILASYHVCTQGYPDTFLSFSFQERQELQQSLRELGSYARQQLLSHIQLPLPTENPTTKLNPEDLATWQEQLEKAINQTLPTISRETNRLLQEKGILPKKLPDAVLEVAAKADPATEVVGGPPNLLNLLIEAEDSPEKENSEVTHIVAVNLRLLEIEFADQAVMAGRNQLRNLVARLSTFRREYRKKHRERAIALAEAAWRASWYEE